MKRKHLVVLLVVVSGLFSFGVYVDHQLKVVGPAIRPPYVRKNFPMDPATIEAAAAAAMQRSMNRAIGLRGLALGVEGDADLSALALDGRAGEGE